MLAAAALAFYSFVGFETAANVAEEARDVRRNYPVALIGGLLLAGALYVLVGLVVTLTVPADQLAGSTGLLLLLGVMLCDLTRLSERMTGRFGHGLRHRARKRGRPRHSG